MKYFKVNSFKQCNLKKFQLEKKWNRNKEFQLQKENIPKSKMFQLEKGNTELRFGKTSYLGLRKSLRRSCRIKRRK